MMRSMRAKGNRTLALILVGLLIVGLAGFGVGGLGGGRINTVASVGDASVTVSAYVRVLNQRLQQMGRALSTSEAEEIGVFRDVLRFSLNIAAVSNEAIQSGISVGDEFVRDSLMGISGFQGIDGNFDQAAYEFSIERAGMTTAEFEEELRDELRRAIVRDAVALGVHSSGALAEAILRFELEQRDFEWARLSESDLDNPVESPTESQIEAHYASHPDDYMSPLTRSLTYSWLRPDMLIDEVDVSDTELREAYDAQPERFDVPEMRAVERVAFETAQLASEARATDWIQVQPASTTSFRNAELNPVTPISGWSPGTTFRPMPQKPYLLLINPGLQDRWNRYSGQRCFGLAQSGMRSRHLLTMSATRFARKSPGNRAKFAGERARLGNRRLACLRGNDRRDHRGNGT